MKWTKTILLLLFATGIRAQSIERAVIGTTGASLQSVNMQLSFTTGETVVTTLQSGSFIATQGFQQPDDVDTATGITPVEVKIDYTLYPNPTAGMVKLILTATDFNCTFHLTDVEGRLIEARENIQITGTTTLQFNLEHLAAGTYLISLVRNQKIVHTFKVQKTN